MSAWAIAATVYVLLWLLTIGLCQAAKRGDEQLAEWHRRSETK